MTRELFEEYDLTIAELNKENKKLNGTIQTYDILLKANVEENKRLKENYDRIYNENCKLREEHNINDISLLDENYRLKKGIYRIYDYLEDKYGCSAIKGIINDTDVDELYEILDEVLE